MDTHVSTNHQISEGEKPALTPEGEEITIEVPLPVIQPVIMTAERENHELQSQPQSKKPTKKYSAKELQLRNALANDKCCGCELRTALVILFTVSFMVEILKSSIFVKACLEIHLISVVMDVIFCGSGIFGLMFYKLKTMQFCFIFGCALLLWHVVSSLVLIKMFDQLTKHENLEFNQRRKLRVLFLFVSVMVIMLKIWILSIVQTVVQAMKSVSRIFQKCESVV